MVSPYRAMSIKSALRDWLSVSYGIISTLVIGSLRSPPPIRAAPDFHLKVKRLTMICASLALLQIMFAVHRFAQGATAPAALRVADCRSAAMLIKSALRDLLSVSLTMDRPAGRSGSYV